MFNIHGSYKKKILNTNVFSGWCREKKFIVKVKHSFEVEKKNNMADLLKKDINLNYKIKINEARKKILQLKLEIWFST